MKNGKHLDEEAVQALDRLQQLEEKVTISRNN